MKYLIKTYGLESVLKYTAEYIKAPKKEKPLFKTLLGISLDEGVIDEARRNASIQASQKSLRLLLESKFGPLSEELVSQFEAVHNVDELDRLYKLALQSQTLEEIGLHERKDA